MIALVALAFALDFPELMSQAQKARESQETDKAIHLYREALKVQPAATEAWWYLGLCYSSKGQHGDATEAFVKVTQQQPKQGAGWAMLGVEQFAMGAYDRSWDSLRRAHTLGVPAMNGLNRIARYHQAILANRAGHFDISGALLMTFVAEDAVTPLVKRAAGISALRLKLLPDQVPASKMDQVRLAGEASIFAWRKLTADARTLVGELLAKYPDEPNANYLMGYLYLLETNPKSIDYFERELKVQPNHVQAREQIAYEYLNRGEAVRGLPYAEAAAKLDPADFIAHNILGRILMAVDRPDDAVRELELAVKLQPSNPEAHFHLASAYNRTHRRNDAARHREIFAKLEKERKRNE